MKFNYINLDGNKAETDDVVFMPDNLEKIWDVIFEKKSVILELKKKVNKIEEPIKEEFNVDDALTFLKEQKVRWAHLLKWDKLIEKAKSLGFKS
jgi:hypothetical protein